MKEVSSALPTRTSSSRVRAGGDWAPLEETNGKASPIAQLTRDFSTSRVSSGFGIGRPHRILVYLHSEAFAN